MHSEFYFIEQMLKYKEMQFVAEAERLRQIKSINLVRTRDRKRKIAALISYLKKLGTINSNKYERLCEGC